MAGEGTPPPAILRAADRPEAPAPGAPWFRVRDTGLAEATGGAFAAQVFRAAGATSLPPRPHFHDADFQLVHVIRGTIDFLFGDETVRLSAGDAVFQPRGCVHCVTAMSDDCELLEITGPAAIATTQVPA